MIRDENNNDITELMAQVWEFDMIENLVRVVCEPSPLHCHLLALYLSKYDPTADMRVPVHIWRNATEYVFEHMSFSNFFLDHGELVYLEAQGRYHDDIRASEHLDCAFAYLPSKEQPF